MDHILGGCVINSGVLEGRTPVGMAEPRAERDDQFQGAGDTQDHANPVAIIVALRPIAGILEGLSSRYQSQELGCVDRLQGGGGDIEFHRIERNRGKEAATLTVGHVRGFGILVVIIRCTPVGGRDVGDGIDAFADSCPVCRAVFGLGKEAANADDSQRNPAGGDSTI